MSRICSGSVADVNYFGTVTGLHDSGSVSGIVIAKGVVTGKSDTGSVNDDVIAQGKVIYICNVIRVPFEIIGAWTGLEGCA